MKIYDHQFGIEFAAAVTADRLLSVLSADDVVLNNITIYATK